jgi:hypothetical protein
MRLPSFTAEASLGKASERYRLHPEPTMEARGVYPQVLAMTESDAGDNGCILSCNGDGIRYSCVAIRC